MTNKNTVKKSPYFFSKKIIYCSIFLILDVVYLRELMNAEEKIAEVKNTELIFANLSQIRKLEFRIF